MANGDKRKESVHNAVYKTLKEGILSMRLIPGTQMSTQEMATRLNVSRTPVREAFIRLQEEGLVEILPQRETLVSRIDMDRVQEERFIRESLELSVVDPFMKRFSKELHLGPIQELISLQKKSLEENQPGEFVKYDNQMHRQFFVVAKKALAWETLQSVNGHDLRFRALVSREPGVMENSIAQHETLVGLMLEGDSEGLRSELQRHLEKWAREKEELITRYPGYFKAEDAESQEGFRPLSLE